MSFMGLAPLHLAHGVGQDGEHARPLHRGRDLALVLRAAPADAPRDDLAALGEEVLELALVLVVDLQSLVGAEPADLAPAETAPPALVAAAIVAIAAVLAAAAAAEAAAATAAVATAAAATTTVAA